VTKVGDGDVVGKLQVPSGMLYAYKKKINAADGKVI